MQDDSNNIDEAASGMDRRSLIKRSAVVGGALVWTTPIVQSIASPAFAVGSVRVISCPPGATTLTTVAKFNFANFTGSVVVGTRDTAGTDNMGACFETAGPTGGPISPGPQETADAGVIISVTKTSATTITVVLAAGVTLSGAGVKAGESCFAGVITAGATQNTFVITVTASTLQNISNILLVITQPCPRPA